MADRRSSATSSPDAHGLFDDQTTLTGEVLGVWFADANSGFGVIELATADGEGVRCAGPVAALKPGQRVTVVGSWADHPRYGDTFETLSWEQAVPTTADELAALLSSEAFADVADGAIERAVAAFGGDLGAVIDREPNRLVAEAGLTDVDAEALRRAWRAGRVLADFLAIVSPLGWPTMVARSAHRALGAQLIEIAQHDPYRMVIDARIGFDVVDRLARSRGIPASDPSRLAAAAVAVIRQLRDLAGHQHVPRSVAVERTQTLLTVDAALAVEAIDQAITRSWLAADDLGGQQVVTEPQALAVERALADEIARLIRARSRVEPAARKSLTPPGGAARTSADGAALTDEQQDAVQAAFTHQVTVLTGGPGTGKTHTVRRVVDIAVEAGLHVALCAPTGRAAKRLEEVVGVLKVTATTIHRMLEARPDGDGGFQFRYGSDEHLPFDLVVVDEVSMCDTWLARQLVAAVDDGAHLLLVGDPDQLPSVGTGDVLADVMASTKVAVASLSIVHRQAAQSRIVHVAHDIRLRQAPTLLPDDGEVFLAADADHRSIVERVVRAVTLRAPERFNVTVDDIQVLCPSYRGPVGVDALNAALKAAINPADHRSDVGGMHIGDRVMQTRNDAELDVANGDVGSVVDLNPRAGALTVRFSRHEVTYDKRQTQDLTLAWAVTVHKAQGGEWPVVVLVVDRSHRAMLWRNLLYTAVTRAQRALIIVGDPKLVAEATQRDGPGRRWTGLAWRLAHHPDLSAITAEVDAVALP